MGKLNFLLHGKVFLGELFGKITMKNSRKNVKK